MEDEQLKAALQDDPGVSDSTETGFDAGRDERDLGSKLDAGYGYGDEDAVVETQDPEAGPLDRGGGESYGGQGGIVQADEG